MRKEKIKSHQGFTLLEVMVAISILAFGLLSVAAMQASALRATFGAYKVTEAAKRAQDRMELLLSLPYSDGLLSGGSHSDESPPQEYTITWNVEENEPMKNMKKVTVTVSWNERDVTRNTVLACLKPRL